MYGKDGIGSRIYQLCVHCGESFRPVSFMGPIPAYCSGRCRTAAHRKRTRDERVRVRAKVDRLIAEGVSLVRMSEDL